MRGADEEERRWQTMLRIEQGVREIRAEQTRQGERLDSHELRIQAVEHAAARVATREDAEKLRNAIEEFRFEALERRTLDLTDEVERAEALGTLKERVGRLEGAQVKAAQRNTAQGALGGSAAVLLIWGVLALLARLLGFEIPSPPQ